MLEAQFPETAATQPEVVAQHFTEAGLPESAVGYWYCAGERAVARSAHVEAVAHLTKGIAVVQALPETPERAQHELSFLLTLGMPLIATKGFSAAEVEHAYTRAQHLCQQVGTPAQLFQVLAGLRAMHSVRGELRTVRGLGEQLLALAQRQHDALLLMEAYRVLAMPLFFLGEFARCQASLEQGWALYDPQRHHILSRYGGTDPVVGGVHAHVLRHEREIHDLIDAVSEQRVDGNLGIANGQGGAVRHFAGIAPGRVQQLGRRQAVMSG